MKVMNAQVAKVLLAIYKQTPGYNHKSIAVLRDHDRNGDCIIAWEEGPYCWTYSFPFGGINEEFGSQVADVSAMLPEGVYVEAATHYSIALYRE